MSRCEEREPPVFPQATIGPFSKFVGGPLHGKKVVDVLPRPTSSFVLLGEEGFSYYRRDDHGNMVVGSGVL